MSYLWRASLVLSMFVSATTLAHAQIREWTDSTGRYKVEAEIVEVTDDGVRLRKSDGSESTVPLNRLSEADQQYAQQFSEQRSTTTSQQRKEVTPLDSVVRIVFPFVNPRGAKATQQILGTAIQSNESNPVVLTNRFAIPGGLSSAALNAGLAKAQIFELRSDRQLGAAEGIGFFSPENVRSLGNGEAVIVLRTTDTTKIPGLTLATRAPAEDEVIKLPRLPSPRISTALDGAGMTIQWVPCSITDPGRQEHFFHAHPSDGEAPTTQVVPVINDRNELVGLTGASYGVLADKRKVADVVGIEEIFAALEKAKIKLPLSDATASNEFMPIPTGPIVANAPWRKSYEQLLASIKVQKQGENNWIFEWGDARDFGAWYERAHVSSIAYSGLMRAPSGSARRRALLQRVEFLDAAIARAQKRLEGIEWTAVVASTNGARPSSTIRFDFPASPEPFGFLFWIEKDDVQNWSDVKKGDKIRFAVRFTESGPTPFPRVFVKMTLKGIVPQ